MPYRKETFHAPGIIEIRKYHTWRLGGKKSRNANWKKTEPAVQKNNARRAQRNLYRLIATNFKAEDYRVDLTYGDPPPDEGEARKRLHRFIRSLQRLYKKENSELKYIYVTECRGHRIHHHLLINAVPGIGRKEIQGKWPWAKMTYRSFRLFDGAPEDCRALAKYLIKETTETIREGALQKTRYCASKNLKKPDVRTETIYSRKWQEKPRPPKGYVVYDLMAGYTEDGFPYQFYRLKKGDNHERSKKRSTEPRPSPGTDTGRRRTDRHPAKNRRNKKDHGPALQ